MAGRPLICAGRCWTVFLVWSALGCGGFRSGDAADANVAVPYQDDFSYASGGRQTQTDGRDPIIEGEIHATMYTYGRAHRQAPGVLQLIMLEDDSVSGPDGRSGVLRLEFADVPVATLYSGFVITGNREVGAIAIPQWTAGEVDQEDLNRTFVSFRFRAENRRDPEDFSVPLNFRFEPDQEGSYPFAADFGNLYATRQWRTMKRPIGSARNLDAFLMNLNNLRVERFKLVWAQVGPIDFYQPGDALLIDDVKITVE